MNRRHAPAWARAVPSSELQAAAPQQADVDRVNTAQDVSATINGSNGMHADARSNSSGAYAPELCSPEDLVLEPGELSHIDRSAPIDSADVFRCSGCLLEACQVCPALTCPFPSYEAHKALYFEHCMLFQRDHQDVQRCCGGISLEAI